MIVLTSNGLENIKLLSIIEKDVRKNGFKNAVLVVTADNVFKDQNWNIERLTKELESLGLEVTLFDFDTDPIRTLKEADVIEFNGGNPYYLLDRINKAAINDFFEAFVKTNILIGVSAGSLVMQKNIKLIDKLTPEMNIINLLDLTAMNLVNIDILPHYNKIDKRLPDIDINQLCLEYESQSGSKIHKLNNGEGIIKHPNDDLYYEFKDVT